MIRRRRRVEAWITAVLSDQGQRELRSFGTGCAATTRLTLEWNSGPSKGTSTS
jgi:ribosomal protein L11 methylase PrmA